MDLKLLGLIVLLAGLVFLLAALCEWLNRRPAGPGAASCAGRVVALCCRRVKADGGRLQTVHEVTVSYTVGGTDYLSVLRILPGEVIHLPGAEIRLLYPYLHPERVGLAPRFPPERSPRGFFIACAVLFAAGIVLFFAAV